MARPAWVYAASFAALRAATLLCAAAAGACGSVDPGGSVGNAADAASETKVFGFDIADFGSAPEVSIADTGSEGADGSGDAADDAGLPPDAELPVDATGAVDALDALDAVNALDAGSDSVSAGCSPTCTIDDDCDPGADPCTAKTCVNGCCQQQPTVGNLCDDGIPCNGPDACKNGLCTPAVPQGCDDGLTCTTDSCDGEKCHHVVDPGWCHIANSCVPDGSGSPGNPCKVCDSKQDQDTWTLEANCCKQDDDCPSPGDCDKPVCDVAAGKCQIVKVPGCCKSNNDCNDFDACTTDLCDVGSGNCSSTPVVCDPPSDCQSATCNPTTGACDPSLDAGWCFIDGACVKSGSANSTNKCQMCNPMIAKTSWAGSPGTYCDDGNACTFSDICTAAGTCKGTKQNGCCSMDSDCPGDGTPCKMGSCNLSVGLCTVVDKPGCCTSGVCCDVDSFSVKPAGTVCGSTIVTTEYSCDGADVRKRDWVQGCSGKFASSCPLSADSGVPGDWQVLQTCPANTQCTVKGSGLTPTCDAVGSCAGVCGGSSSSGCLCAAGCSPGGSCCADASQQCGCSSGACCDTTAGLVIASGTPCGASDAVSQWQCSGNAIQKRSGQGKCVGSSSCSTAGSDIIWGSWQDTQTCANGCTAAADNSSASCNAPAFSSCLGRCGVPASPGGCSCASDCEINGNCCGDYITYSCNVVPACNSVPNWSCNGICGQKNEGGNCWCDTTCFSLGDCCPDVAACGCPTP